MKRPSFETTFVAAFGAFFFGGLVYEIAEDYHPAKLGVAFLFGWTVVLLVVHELGHALAARLVGGSIDGIVIGYGEPAFETRVFGVPLVFNRWPVEGFVLLGESSDSLPRVARAFVFAAGVGAEACVVLPLIAWNGPARLFVQYTEPVDLLVRAAAVELAFSAFANLIPRTAFGSVGARAGSPNDGLGIVRSLFGPARARSSGLSAGVDSYDSRPMNVAVRVVLGGLLVLASVFGYRLWSEAELIDRTTEFRAALRTRGLAAERGMDSLPSITTLEERAVALGEEYRLELSELEATVERDAAPVGAAGLVANRMGEVAGTTDVDEDGALVAGAPTSLRTTRVAIRVHVHAKGFLVDHDEDVVVERNIGFAMH